MTEKVTLQTVVSLMSQINPAKWDGPSISETLRARRELGKLKARPDLMEENARRYLESFPL